MNAAPHWATSLAFGLLSGRPNKGKKIKAGQNKGTRK